MFCNDLFYKELIYEKISLNILYKFLKYIVFCILLFNEYYNNYIKGLKIFKNLNQFLSFFTVSSDHISPNQTWSNLLSFSCRIINPKYIGYSKQNDLFSSRHARKARGINQTSVTLSYLVALFSD